jgi:hypothetical protein
MSIGREWDLIGGSSCKVQKLIVQQISDLEVVDLTAKMTSHDRYRN